ncbi:MAG TPA: SAM-dependent methyltransferase [Ignavibacteria bacterium]|nr:SAM-dependent methyltransferase [Ignavibacteria bacterium]
MNKDNEKEKFVSHLKESLDKNTFVKIAFGKYKGGDREFESIFVNRLETKEGEKLSFKFRYKTKDIVKNYEFEKGINLADEILGKDFFSATLFTTENDFTLDYSKKRIPILHIKKPKFDISDSAEHNKIKSRFIEADSKFLYHLGITTSEGKVKSDKYDKFRQVDKFIEILDSLYKASNLHEKDKIKIIDMGSGKSYLTFAMYGYFKNKLNKNIQIRGIEQRNELTELSNRIAGQCEFEKLNFITGNIESLNTENEEYDIAVALHACDTATDDAICKAIKFKSEIIILAPCCQKYVRKKMKSPDNLKGIYRHGILLERLAVSVTDGLRALTLEYSGYETKVFEFISSEHTARNTMITAVKKGEKNVNKLKEIEAVKTEFCIDDYYLDKKLEVLIPEQVKV